MNFMFLKYFYDAARLKSVSGAAGENFVSQSAVSQGIVQLERMLNVSLLTHKRNALKLTDEGVRLFEQSKALLAHVDDVKSAVVHGTAMVGRVKFALSHSLGTALLPRVCRRLKVVAPGLKPYALFAHTGMIKQWLLNGDIEFGFVLDNDDLTAFSTELLYRGDFCFYQSAKLPKVLGVTQCLFPPERSEIHIVKEMYQKKFGRVLETEMDICSWEIIEKLICDSDSVGFLPDYMSFENTAISRCALDLKVPYAIYAAYPRGEELSQGGRAMINIFSDTLKSV